MKEQEVEVKNALVRRSDMGWGEECSSSADHLWWSSTRDTKGWVKPKACSIFSRKPCLLTACSTHSDIVFIHAHYDNKTERLRSLRHQQPTRAEAVKREGAEKQLITSCLSSISLHLFPRMSQIPKTFMCKKSHCLYSLFFCPVVYCILPVCWNAVQKMF